MSTPKFSRIIVSTSDRIIDGPTWSNAKLVILVFAKDKIFRVIKNSYGPEHDGPHDLSTLGQFVAEWEEKNDQSVDKSITLSEVADIAFTRLVASGVPPAKAASDVLGAIIKHLWPS